MKHFHTLGVCRRWIHKQQVLANRAGEKLRVLGNEANLLAQFVQIDAIDWNAVVKNRSSLRCIEANQQLYQCAFAGAGGANERDEISTGCAEIDLVQR